MMENELRAIWQSSPNHERIKFKKSRLILELQSILNSFERTTRYWDLIEIGVALTMIPLFGYQVFRLPSFVAKLGALLITVWLVFVISNVIKLKKIKPCKEDAYLDYLKQSKQYLENHKRFSDKLMSRYVIPCLIGVALITIGKLDLMTKSLQEIVQIRLVWISLFLFTGIGILAYILNRRVLNKEFKPKLKKLDVLLRLMEMDQDEN